MLSFLWTLLEYPLICRACKLPLHVHLKAFWVVTPPGWYWYVQQQLGPWLVQCDVTFYNKGCLRVKLFSTLLITPKTFCKLLNHAYVADESLIWPMCRRNLKLDRLCTYCLLAVYKDQTGANGNQSLTLKHVFLSHHHHQLQWILGFDNDQARGLIWPEILIRLKRHICSWVQRRHMCPCTMNETKHTNRLINEVIWGFRERWQDNFIQYLNDKTFVYSHLYIDS